MFADEPTAFVQKDLLIHLDEEIGGSVVIGDVQFRIIGTVDDRTDKLKVKWKPVPNTLRATEATWHPSEPLLDYRDSSRKEKSVLRRMNMVSKMSDFFAVAVMSRTLSVA